MGELGEERESEDQKGEKRADLRYRERKKDFSTYLGKSEMCKNFTYL